MDPRKLVYLASVIENGSFNKASKQLEITQPALSTSIDRLEQSLGGRLLKRSPVGVTPTQLGELLYGHARSIREELRLAGARVKTSDYKAHAPIILGGLPSLMSYIIPQAICRWRETYADTALRVSEEPQLQLLFGLMKGDLDLIVGNIEYHTFADDLKQRVLFRDRLHVIARPGHPIFDSGNLSWANVAQFPWILDTKTRHRTRLERILELNDVEMPRSVTECTSSASCLKTLVAGSNSLALLPASAMQTDVQHGRLKPLDLDHPILNRDIAAIFRNHRPLSQASRDLIDAVASAGQAVGF